VGRVIVRTIVGLVLLLLLAVALTLSIDLGPSLRGRAERAASGYLKRPVTIGKLSARLLPGRFIVEDFRIAGLQPDDRPFLTARRIEVVMPWWTAFRNEIVFRAIHMTDWNMVIETFPNGRHNFPRFVPERREPRGPRRFTTTLQYVTADKGNVIYDDHSTPWQTLARNVNVSVFRSGRTYRGHSSFRNGLITIQSYVPMSAEMTSTFRIDGGLVHFDRIDLLTDGARSVVTGDLHLNKWPEQLYQVRSQIQFKRMRELFFANEAFTLSGQGVFEGTFHLFKGGRELRGRFSSPLAGVNDYRFPNLRGTVVWLPDRLDVPEATAEVFGGRSQFTYRMWKPAPRAKWLARFDAQYQEVDLARYTDFLGTSGLRLAGRASGRNLLEWPVGRFSAGLSGEGSAEVTPPGGAALQGPELTEASDAAAAARGLDVGPFNPDLYAGYVPVGARVTYKFLPDRIELGESWISTPSTYVTFSGDTAWLEEARIPFHVTSADWQESDRLMAAILTAFNSPTRAVEIGGYGTFDGVMLKSFRSPRIEGAFEGKRLSGWNVVWGDGRAKVVIENSYASVTDAVIAQDGSEIRVDGRFSLGYPRRDGGDEIDARVFLKRRPLSDLRLAFELYDYPVEGLTSGEFRLAGKYEGPTGFGRLQIDEGVAYDEPFEQATAGLRFEGTGVRLDGITIRKSTGQASGAAWVGWDGSYSYNIDGRRVPLESVRNFEFPRAPLSGLMQFTASGNGRFDAPRYDVRFRVEDLYAGEEGIGQVTGRLGIRGDLMSLEVEAASPRLVVSGSGQIELTDEMDAEMTFRFSDTSLDPYVRTFVPKLSPFTTAVASGTIRVTGELYVPEHLLIDVTVEQLDAELFDYRVRNDGPLRLAFDQQTVRATRLRLAGEGTQLDVAGQVDLRQDEIAVRATGDASLGLLQGFFRDVRGSGVAELVAEVRGSLREPVFSGNALISNGRIRHFSLPHSLDAIDGCLWFDAYGIRMGCPGGRDLTARLGGGIVRFDGRVGFSGYTPGELSVTATGEGMRLRYPEGFRSVVDADLALRGPVAGPLLTGTVTVRSGEYTRRFDAGGGVFGFGGETGPTGGGLGAAVGYPLRFDVRVVAPSTLRVDNNVADIVSSADLTLRGTYDRPLLFGRADIERGWVTFEGNRYQVTRGSILFENPARIEPYFDFEAETRVRVPGQTFVVTLGVSGTADRISFNTSSDPPLPPVAVLSLLLGETTELGDAELRALRRGQQAEQELFTAAGARLLTTQLSDPVGRVGEQLGLDTVQITPLVGELSTLEAFNPAARVTFGKRISSRVYVTFSQALGAGRQEQIILIEYDQSDRLGWILSRNVDGTFALDFRVRHNF
jgi:hypothetical protein